MQMMHCTQELIVRIVDRLGVQQVISGARIRRQTVGGCLRIQTRIGRVDTVRGSGRLAAAAMVIAGEAVHGAVRAQIRVVVMMIGR